MTLVLSVFNKYLCTKKTGAIVISTSLLIILFDVVYYPSFLPKIITSDNSYLIVLASYIFYSVLLGSFLLIICGFRSLRVQRKKTKDSSYLPTPPKLVGLLNIIGDTLSYKKYSLMFWPIAVGYGIFYALISGIIVFKTEGFSSLHGIAIPSITITSYGPSGYVPMLTVYFTDHLGLLIIPINLLITVFVSSLVGLNAVLSVYVLRNLTRNGVGYYKKGINKSKASLLTLFGASVGLFAACPTCASFYIFGVMAGSMVSTIASFTAAFHIVFLIVSVPLLFTGIFMTAAVIRRLSSGASCSVMS
jgi:hypothetical protein